MYSYADACVNVCLCLCAYVVCAHQHLCTIFTCLHIHTWTLTQMQTYMPSHACTLMHLQRHTNIYIQTVVYYVKVPSVTRTNLWHTTLWEDKETNVIFVLTALCCPPCSITKVCCMWVIWFVQYVTKYDCVSV